MKITEEITEDIKRSHSLIGKLKLYVSRNIENSGIERERITKEIFEIVISLIDLGTKLQDIHL